MPKRRTNNFKQLQGPSSATSSAASRKDGGDESSQSVNERLRELRNVETPEGLQKKRELAASVNQRSVPPELRGILGIQESAPPKPKAGLRTRDRMRTPGPAPPRSWLGVTPAWHSMLTGRGIRKSRRPGAEASERTKPDHLLRFTRMIGDEPQGQPTGLLHLALKRMAEQWELFDEEDYPALVNIPLRLRLRLLTYIGYYGPALDTAALEALTQGSDPVKHLDLGGLAGHVPLTMRKLARFFEETASAFSMKLAEEVAESWDTEETLDSAMLTLPRVSPFASLTHLCLSHPPPTALWRDLLAVAMHVPHVTHLSLAYWPRPTLTPNLSTATISSQHSPVISAGGSHLYSHLDSDFTEPAALLRRLSCFLLRLQWLDLEGCQAWAPALANLVSSPALTPPSDDSQNTNDDWAVRLPVTTILSDTWKTISYINCSQGWLPSVSGIQCCTSPEQSFASSVLKHLRSNAEVDATETADHYDVNKRKAHIWMESEQRMSAAARWINVRQRENGCRPVTFDFGWRQVAV